MWEAIIIIAILAGFFYWYLSPAVGRRSDLRDHEEDIRYHEAAYDFALLCVRAAEQYGNSLIVSAGDEGLLDDLSLFEIGEHISWAVLRSKRGVRVICQAKKDYAVDALLARFPGLAPEVADVMIEEALADEAAGLSGITIEGDDYRVIDEATGEILMASGDEDEDEDEDPCEGCNPDTCKANCQKREAGASAMTTDPLPHRDDGYTAVVDENGHVEGGSVELDRMISTMAEAQSAYQEPEDLDFIEDYDGEPELPLDDTFAGQAAGEEVERQSRVGDTPASLPSEYLELGDSQEDEEIREEVHEAIDLDEGELHLDFADEDEDETERIDLDDEDETTEFTRPGVAFANSGNIAIGYGAFTTNEPGFTLGIDSEIVEAGDEETELVVLVPEEDEELPDDLLDVAIPIPVDDEDEELHEVTDDDIVSDTEALILSLPPIEDDIEDADESSDDLGDYPDFDQWRH